MSWHTLNQRIVWHPFLEVLYKTPRICHITTPYKILKPILGQCDKLCTLTVYITWCEIIYKPFGNDLEIVFLQRQEKTTKPQQSNRIEGNHFFSRGTISFLHEMISRSCNLLSHDLNTMCVCVSLKDKRFNRLTDVKHMFDNNKCH